MKSFIVDSFTTVAFSGNQAGVCLVESALDDSIYLKIAGEFGFSETAFVAITDKADKYTIRYFSPKKEIPLCGHATLAAAKVLFQTNSAELLHFTTIAGLDLLIRRNGTEILLEFPRYDLEAVDTPTAVLQALGIGTVLESRYSTHTQIIQLEVHSSAELAALKPDFKALLAAHSGINGVLVTAAATDDTYDYHYRYFWPWAGTDEDPVTGGVQTFLAPYWSAKLNKTQLKCFQSSARTGSMSVEVFPDKVCISGNAVIVLEGHLTVV